MHSGLRGRRVHLTARPVVPDHVEAPAARATQLAICIVGSRGAGPWLPLAGLSVPSGRPGSGAGRRVFWAFGEQLACSCNLLFTCVCLYRSLCLCASETSKKSARPQEHGRGAALTAMRTPVATRRSLSPHWTGTPEYVDRKLEPSAALLSGSTAALSCGIASSMRPTLASLSASSDSTRGGTEMCTTAALPERKKYKHRARGKMSATPRE